MPPGGPIAGPFGENELMLEPRRAITTGIASGDQGRRVGVFGSSESNIGVYGRSTSGQAGYFDGDVNVKKNMDVQGNVRVTGNISAGGDIILSNADCAEDFDIADAELVEPGTVMVLGDDGALHQSHCAYDKRVAGVVSGAGEYKPGIVLDKRSSDRPRKPVALLGKVFCKVDATQSAIEVGDLLTTSTTPGHAMKVVDSAKALGTIIGKALRPFKEGQGMIPILIALQ
ncbi:MAG: hypothetical protein CV089_09475 [Nitrospira sp. WS110]|nr:hypothetical protein [Nitrospira sp. WS110]